MGYAFWQKIGLFRHGKMDEASYVQNNFVEYCSFANLNPMDLKGKTILELGPGDSIATALIASSYGAKTILLDAGSYAINDISVYKSLANELIVRGVNLPNIDQVQTMNELLNKCNAKYLTNGLKDFFEIKDDSIDLIVSQAVLEHIRKNEFKNLFRECSRVLKLSGVSVHSVDLKDHLNKALNNLRFTDKFWEFDFIANSGFYTNRIRYSEMIKIFEKSGFTTKVIKKNKWTELPTPREHLAYPFNLMNDDELLVSDFTVVLKKQANV